MRGRDKVRAKFLGCKVAASRGPLQEQITKWVISSYDLRKEPRNRGQIPGRQSRCFSRVVPKTNHAAGWQFVRSSQASTNICTQPAIYFNFLVRPFWLAPICCRRAFGGSKAYEKGDDEENVFRTRAVNEARTTEPGVVADGSRLHFGPLKIR
jgi:hypothetical protein